MRRLRIGRRRGLTLVELMVAMTVGLGVALIAGRLLLLANEAYAAGAETAALDDGGRLVMAMLARAVRQASSFDPGAPGANGARLSGLDARSLPRTTPALESPLANAVNGSDVLAVRFPGASDGGALGCAGFAVNEGEEGWSIFYVARSSTGEAELRCKYRGAGGWSSDALVGGVDGFQVLYGIDTDTPPDHVPNRYLNADALARLDAAPPYPGGSWWARVVSVRAGLLLHGARPVRRVGTLRHDLLGPVYAGAAGDADPGSSIDEAELPANERRLFVTTVALPSPPPSPLP